MVRIPAPVVGEQTLERLLALVAERRVAYVVSNADGVGKRAVEAEAAGKGAADLRRSRPNGGGVLFGSPLVKKRPLCFVGEARELFGFVDPPVVAPHGRGGGGAPASVGFAAGSSVVGRLGWFASPAFRGSLWASSGFPPVSLLTVGRGETPRGGGWAPGDEEG